MASVPRRFADNGPNRKRWSAYVIGNYSYWGVAIAVGLGSMGVPVPGETALVAAAVYAGTTHHLNIGWVIASAAVGAIIGDNIGFWIGRVLGFRFLLRYGRYVGLNEGRLKLGQYLFLRHGGKVVFFGRFIAVLRALAALLAGVNRMRWPRFLFFNAAGGIVWAAGYGVIAYVLGSTAQQLLGEIGLAVGAVAVAVIIVAVVVGRRHMQRLKDEAERALPGPLHR
jgi:membrane protein DedA with SNARE-associated domain